MAGVKRTANCKKCGSVIFKVKQRTGGAVFRCIECDNELNVVKCDKYQTLSKNCEDCGGEEFKVRITPYEKDYKIERWSTECTSCAGAPG